jgi:hypothetical protein
MNARQSALLLRVDIGRHDPRVVATDLALSTRQFHRERRSAHDRFFRVYSGMDVARPVEIVAETPRHVLARAASLADSGETTSAQAILYDVACSGTDASLRAESLTRLAQIAAWDHRFDRGRTYAHDARLLLEGAELPAEQRAQLRDQIDAVDSVLRWFEYGPETIEQAPRNGRSSKRERLVRASAALRSGESALAIAISQELDDLSPALRDPEAAVDLLVLRAELADFTARDPLLSEELFGRAAATAQAHGLRGREMYATHQRMLTKWMNGRKPQDRSAYRQLVDRIDPALPPRLRSYLIFSAADIELAIGHPKRALEAARSAARVSTNRFERFSARGLAAGALLRLGRIDDAGVEAALAATDARTAGHSRVLGLAQRIGAQVYLVHGNRPEARAAIEESIEIARHFSSQYVISQTQALRERIRAS